MDVHRVGGAKTADAWLGTYARVCRVKSNH